MIKLLRKKICKSYQLGLYVATLGLSVLTFNPEVSAHFHHDHYRPDRHNCEEDALELGVALETEFWTLVQNQCVEKFSEKLAHIFQGLKVSGVYSRAQQINGLVGSTLPKFIINNPEVFRDKNVLVLSYDFIAINSDLTSGPSVTVWKKYDCDCGWKIVSHSYVPFSE